MRFSLYDQFTLGLANKLTHRVYYHIFMYRVIGHIFILISSTIDYRKMTNTKVLVHDLARFTS